MLVLSKAPHGHEKMEAMLVGSILFVSWSDVLSMLLLYIPLGILHFATRRVLMSISENIGEAESAGIRVRAWDLLFYASFGLMVTQSVSIAGVLVVFSYLIIPVVCAIMFVDSFFWRMFIIFHLLFDGFKYLKVVRVKLTKDSHSNINGGHNQTTNAKEHLRSLPNLSSKSKFCDYRKRTQQTYIDS